MYQALYRAYRPEVFSEILGQEHIVKILKNQINTDAVSHAYLFCGTRGTGKTTTARIIAKGVNCTSEGERPCGECANCKAIKQGNFIDVIEIDAASNNGVDNIRELRESIKYPPAVGRKKVYIIDEVHMLSQGAFNALLKTLEEPPEYVMFILATTEPQKLPATILSRCMRLDFKRVSENVLREGMSDICRQKGINVTDGAMRLIAANADGSVRDGLSILDQCISTGQKEIGRDDVLEFLGTSGEETFAEITEYVTAHKVQEALLLLDRILADGKDVRQFMKDWLAHYRSLMISKFIRSPEDILNMSTENVDRIKKQGAKLDLPEINSAIIELSKTMADAKWSTQPRILLELCIVKLSGEMAVQRQKPTAFKEIQQRPELEVERNTKEDDETIVAEDKNITDPNVQNDGQNENYDLGALWHMVFETGETMKTSFNLIRSGTTLQEVTEKDFLVVASNDLKLRYVKENKQTLEGLMEKHTGKFRVMRCRVEGGREETGKTDIDKLKAEAENLLGIDITIE